MEESTTYQAIMEKGRLQAVREDIRRLGEHKFKRRLPTHAQATLEGIDDYERLQQLVERVLDVTSWDELLASVTEQGLRTRRKKK